jgi:hypothetical protein
MIPLIVGWLAKGWLKWLLLGLVVAAVVGIGWTVKGWENDAAQYSIVKPAYDTLVAEKIVWQDRYDKQVAEKQRVEAANAELSRRIDDELVPALETATATGTGLADRLRDYQARARRCALSSQGSGTGSPPGPSGEPTDGEGTGPGAVDSALKVHLEACARDAVRLDGWREFWNELP